MIPFLGPIICVACDVTCLEHWILVLWQRKVMFLVPGITLNRTAELLQVNALTRCRQLVTSVPPQNLGFISRAVSVGYDVDKATLGQVSFVYLNFPLSLSFHQCPTYHYYYIILTIVSIMK
jgi:hypothetical protein